MSGERDIKLLMEQVRNARNPKEVSVENMGKAIFQLLTSPLGQEIYKRNVEYSVISGDDSNIAKETVKECIELTQEFDKQFTELASKLLSTGR